MTRRTRLLTAGGAGVFLAYAAFGFLVLPSIVRSMAIERLRKLLVGPPFDRGGRHAQHLGHRDASQPARARAAPAPGVSFTLR